MNKRTDEIVFMRVKGKMKLKDIGAKFGISRQMVSFILKQAGVSFSIVDYRRVKCRGCAVEMILVPSKKRIFHNRECSKQYNRHRCLSCKSERQDVDRQVNRLVCNPCNTTRMKKWRNTREGKNKVYKITREYDKRNPGKRVAWTKAQRNIERTPCIICGRQDSVRHHPDISKPLEVIMLCHLHHSLAHNNYIAYTNLTSNVL